jgi:hypothetical protein
MISEKQSILSPREYLQLIYDTGRLPIDGQRPVFSDLLDQHISVIEILAHNDVPLVIIQTKTATDPLLVALLHDLPPQVNQV